MNDDPLIPFRAAPREAPDEIRQRILTTIGDDFSRMHLEHVRLAVQERLHKEFGIVVVFKQEPMPPVQNMNLQEIEFIEPKVEERPKRSTIPIPNQRRKWWER